jgi:hypothetical protein
VEDEARAVGMVWIRVLEVIDAAAVHARRPANHAMNLVALAQQELGQVRAVLAGDSSDQGPN